MSEKVQPKVGDSVRFSVGRSKTSFEASVVGIEGAFLVTKDAVGVQRKVRPGSCTVL